MGKSSAFEANKSSTNKKYSQYINLNVDYHVYNNPQILRIITLHKY